MSFILDALKKSEAERQRQAGPALLEMRVVRPQRRIPVWVWIGGGALLLVNALVVAFFALRSPSGAAPSDPAAATQAGGTAPVATSPQVAPGASAGTLPGPSVTTVAPGAAPGAWVNATSGASQDRAAAQYQTPPAASDVEPGNPADFEPATPPSGGASVGVGRSSGDVRNYAEVGGNVPELRLDLHVFAAKPGDRYAFINMRKVKEGDITAEGARVMEITRDGVVLNYRSTEFLLGRE